MRINGYEYSHPSLRFSVAALALVGIKSINYSDKLTPGKVRGTRARVIARTRGVHETDGSMEMSLQDAKDLRNTLGPGYGTVSFDVVIVASEPGLPTLNVELKGCRIVGVDNSSSEGSDPLVEKLTLDILDILRDGKSIVPTEV